jgi:hypothetical protein
MVFIPNEEMHIVFCGEAVERFGFVFCDAIPQCAGHANIVRAALTIGGDVNSRELFFAHDGKIIFAMCAVKGLELPSPLRYLSPLRHPCEGRGPAFFGMKVTMETVICGSSSKVVRG